jgi:hypothetical protein
VSGIRREEAKRLAVGGQDAEVAFVERQDVVDLVVRGEDRDRRVGEADPEVGVTLDDRARVTDIAAVNGCSW